LQNVIIFFILHSSLEI